MLPVARTVSRETLGQLANQAQPAHMQVGSHHQAPRKGDRIDAIQTPDPLRNIRVETVGQHLGPHSGGAVKIAHKGEVRQHQMAVRKAGRIASRDSIPSHHKPRTAVPQHLRLEPSIEIFLIVKNHHLGIEPLDLLAQDASHPTVFIGGNPILGRPLLLERLAIQHHFHQLQPTASGNRPRPKIRPDKHLAQQALKTGCIIVAKRLRILGKQRRQHLVVIAGCLENPHVKTCIRTARCPRRKASPSIPAFRHRNNRDSPFVGIC